MGLAFAAFKPAAEAAPKSSENTAKVGNMAEPKMKVAGMKEFDDFSGKVSGWAVTNLTKDEKTSYFQRLADNKASVKKSVREYVRSIRSA